MYARPINETLRNGFEEIYIKNIAKAEGEYDDIITSLENHDHLSKLKAIAEEYEKIKEKIKSSGYTFYSSYYSSKEWLLNQFSNRFYLLEIDESRQLGEAIYLGKLKSQLGDIKYKLRDLIPKYTFKQFLRGKICPYFTFFSDLYNLTAEDYYAIRGWQSEKLKSIVLHDSKLLIVKMQQHCSNLDNPHQFINDERNIIEDFIDQQLHSPEEIKIRLKKLWVLKDHKFANFDDEVLLAAHKAYYSSEIWYAKLAPAYLKSPLANLTKTPNECISDEASIFGVVSQLRIWFDKIISGEPLQAKVLYENYEEIFIHTEIMAKDEADELIFALEETSYNSGLSKKKVKTFLIEQLETYRHRFNKLETKDVMMLMRDERKYLLKYMFTTNAFFSGKLEKEKAKLIEAIILQEVIWAIAQIYNDIFDTHKMDFKGNDFDYLEITDLVNKMVLDDEIFLQIHDSQDEFFKGIHAYFLPYNMHFRNHFETLRSVYKKAADRLLILLDRSESTKKIMYLQTRLKEVRHRILEVKQFDEFKTKKKNESTYLKRFEEFLAIEAAFIDQTWRVPSTIPEIKGKKILLSSPVEANEVFSIDTINFIMQLLDDLGITKDGKSIVTQRSKSALRGVVEALIDHNRIPSIGLEKSYRFIADTIGLQISSRLDHSNTSVRFKNKAETYLKNLEAV